MNSPTKEQIAAACARLSRLLDRKRGGHEVRPTDLEDVRTILAAIAPHLDDPRPDDMAELARLTAVELRKRGIWAVVEPHPTAAPVVFTPYCYGPIERSTLHGRPHAMYFGEFDNLGPVGCADVIQTEEARRAKEWAGDK